MGYSYSSKVRFASELGHPFSCFRTKSVKLNLLTAIRTGGQMVTAGNGIALIGDNLSLYATVMGL